MSLAAGQRLGTFEILGYLGAGGMGEVYRGRDTALNRDVAIKVLPELFALDGERLARFKREAQVLASLNHQNIAAIYGFVESDPSPGSESAVVHALVLELVEGPTLADRLAQGPIPVDEALPIARQIAEGLEAAHEQGIIHRDLKPANIKLRPDGRVKVLDFGLAKVLEPVGAAAGDAAASPTITSPAMTAMGLILGTAAYMSPEQAKGRQADKRSDVWAFGAVLYEMLSGRRAFGGDDLSDTLAAVLKVDPDWSVLPADVPPHLRMLVQRCLAKVHRERIADMSTTLFVMNDSASLLSVVSMSVAERAGTLRRQPVWRRLLMPLAALIAGGAVTGAGVGLAMRPGTVRLTRFAFSPPPGPGALSVDPQSRDFTITPDGAHVVYKGSDGATGTQLFLRALDQTEPKPLTGPGMPRAPFASPDGQWIGFVEPGPVTLKKVAINGGPVAVLCSLDGPSRGATWGEDDTIIFGTALPSTGLQRVSSRGGEPTVLTKPDSQRGEHDHLWPQFLPGSQVVLFTITPITGGVDASEVAVYDLRTKKTTIVLRGGSQAQYLPSGHLVYAAAGTLRGVEFDLRRLKVVGTPVPVLSPIVTLPTGTAEFDVADDGTLVYLSSGAGAAQRTLVWVDRQGHEEPIKAPPRFYGYPRLSPDGKRLAVDIRDQDNDIWVFDFSRETLQRVTSDPGIDSAPAWIPDGQRLVFTSRAGGVTGALFSQAADGTGPAEQLTHGPYSQRPSAVLADAAGTHVLFSQAGATTAADVMMLTLENGRVESLVQGKFFEQNAEVSPDGRWLAYESGDSGRLDVSVRPFNDVKQQRVQVSTAGGTQPLWSRNGQELFYLAPSGALMSVQVEAAASWRASLPEKVIERGYYRGIGNNVARTYDVSLDGKRFLMIKEVGGPNQVPAPTSLIVVQHWFEELKRLVPTK